MEFKSREESSIGTSISGAVNASNCLMERTTKNGLFGCNKIYRYKK